MKKQLLESFIRKLIDEALGSHVGDYGAQARVANQKLAQTTDPLERKRLEIEKNNALRQVAGVGPASSHFPSGPPAARGMLPFAKPQMAVETPMMIDAGSQAERQVLVRDVMSSLADAEDIRERLMDTMKNNSDPAEALMYQEALDKFNAIIKDQYDLLRTLAVGTKKLRGKNMPENKQS